MPDINGAFNEAYVWDGLLSVKDETPGREINPLYQNGQRYANAVKNGDFAGSISAYTYPEAFEMYQGMGEVETGITASNQPQYNVFGMSYRTMIGNANNPKAGYRIHILYNLTAIPEDQTYDTVGNSLEADELSWKISGVPVKFPGLRPTCHYVIDSRRVNEEVLLTLEEFLYGSDGYSATLFSIEDLKKVLKYDTIKDIITEPL